MGSIPGNAVPRVEDPDLLHGRGSFIDKLRIDGMLSFGHPERFPVLQLPLLQDPFLVAVCTRLRACTIIADHGCRNASPSLTEPGPWATANVWRRH